MVKVQLPGGIVVTFALRSLILLACAGAKRASTCMLSPMENGKDAKIRSMTACGHSIPRKQLEQHSL